MSDSDAGGEKEQESKRASRPVTAAARRERRASARPAGKASAKDTDKARPAKAAVSADGAKTAETKGKATPKRDRKEKKASLLSRFMRFIREVWAELRKVIWPTRNQMVTYTTVVLVFVAFMVALVYLLDWVFRKGVFWLFG
ncbi:preprotein translocase subunit SecE [Amycolatopsis sp. GM8]|uniref:preprotein translocase subunit SecE n=1 Tax=Amycolatopsis sp. GM8 TaxID=2896530 RepID=UPI001F01E97B|nr:preprotein translocase subunit SecE [Amycolatopsis sp. GM8]